MSSEWSLSLRSPHQNPARTSPLPYTCHIPRPSHSFFISPPEYQGEERRTWSFSLRSLLHSRYLAGPSIFLSTLLSNTLSLCSSLNMRDQDSHPYKTGTHIIHTNTPTHIQGSSGCTVCRYPACSQKSYHRKKPDSVSQCFSIFVRPRPGKFFFHKMRVRSQQIYS